MRLRFTFEFKYTFDSQKLWNEIERYKLNLTDTGTKVILHGEADAKTLANVMTICMKYSPMYGAISPEERRWS